MVVRLESKVRFNEIMIIYYIVAAVMVAFDQWTKYATVANIPLHETVEFLPGILSFTYIQNDGAAWSILEGQMLFFYIITTIVLVVIIYHMQKYGHESRLLSWALTFVLAGTLGNFIDRLRLQYVVDMLQLEFIEFPIFNVADSLLTIGMIILILYVFMDERAQKKKQNRMD